MQGFLLLSKPTGITSFSAVSAIKRMAHEKRVGHTGTLDPMATGVLPIFLGRATALSSLMLDGDKSYKATIKLGITTDTEDITGKVLQEREVKVTNEQLEKALNNFLGKILQTPPMYSALKKDGVRLYELARKGETVEIPKREIEIFSIDLLSPLDSENCFSVSVKVSKGTYIRSLARDIGEFLGCGATLTALQRTSACGFDIDSCVKLEDLNQNNITDFIKSEETAVMHLREVTVTEKQAIRFCNGGQLDFSRLRIENVGENELIRVKYEEKFLGVGVGDTINQRLNIKCIINDYKAVAK
ncbi:MAG: tRNA pseudouridine(55) synthase TruB [Ruminococcaceae bacterium]|nr:tRNA pseudouridine(55) synthase TruB [Oscillospiraceae bacterium]